MSLVNFPLPLADICCNFLWEEPRTCRGLLTHLNEISDCRYDLVRFFDTHLVDNSSVSSHLKKRWFRVLFSEGVARGDTLLMQVNIEPFGIRFRPSIHDFRALAARPNGVELMRFLAQKIHLEAIDAIGLLESWSQPAVIQEFLDQIRPAIYEQTAYVFVLSAACRNLSVTFLPADRRILLHQKQVDDLFRQIGEGALMFLMLFLKVISGSVVIVSSLLLIISLLQEISLICNDFCHQIAIRQQPQIAGLN
jgi:hypothetical protein